MSIKVIGGATAKAWLDSGASQLIADPASFPGGIDNGPYIATDLNATDTATVNMFDALDRDALNSGVFGIGVHNPYSSTDFVQANQFPGISSTPSEIGYYTDANGTDQADTLDIKLDGALSHASANVSFFYQGEGQSGETLSYELYLNGVKVGGDTITSGNTESYSPSDPGYYTFALDHFTSDVQVFDEVKFLGAAQANPLDASDFLVESITGDTAEGLSPGYWKTHTSLWDQSTELNNVTTTDSFKDYFQGINPDGVSNALLGGPGGLTLQEVLGLTGGGEQALARQAVSALLNINSDKIDAYPMTQGELVSHVHDALAGNDAAVIAALTHQLETYNTLETHWA
jgi:hypothetical protein